MKSSLRNLVIISALSVSALSVSVSSFAQVVLQPGCSSYGNCGQSNGNTYNQYQPSSRMILESIHSNGKLEQMIRFVNSLEGRVDYYTYGEIFLPIKLEIGSLKTVTAVYGPAHQQTYLATMKLLKMIDSHWDVIGNFKNTEMFFETINYFELVLLQLKRDTYL